MKLIEHIKAAEDCFRNTEIQQRFKRMFIWLRDYIQEPLIYFNNKKIININDERQAAGLIITLMEGLEFHAHFLSENRPFEIFSLSVKKHILTLLKTGGI